MQWYYNLPVTTLDDHIWTFMDLGVGGYVAGRSLEKISENLGPVLYNVKRKKRRRVLIESSYGKLH